MSIESFSTLWYTHLKAYFRSPITAAQSWQTALQGRQRPSYFILFIYRKFMLLLPELLDYSMVLRCLFYDTGEYEKQYRAIRREVRKNGGKLTAGEYLYGFRKDSRLYPVVTFILYYGEEEWDGATDLHGILDFEGIPEPLREMDPNYRINVIDIRRLKDTSMFHTDVRQVFDFIRYSKDPEQLKKLVTEDKAYQELEEDTYDFVTQYTHADELVQVKDYCY